MSLQYRSRAQELMDGEDISDEAYSRCLADLASVNRVTLTHRATLHWLDAQTSGLRRGDSFSLLEVACGRGDFLRIIHSWALARGLEPELTGIDLNPRSTEEARNSTPAANAIRFVTGDVFSLGDRPRTDWVISSQFAHHLSDDEVVRFLRWMETVARRGWYVADLRRHWLSYYGFRLLCRLAGWHPLVRHDGTVSIARSFRPQEWKALLERADTTATLEAHFPFRLCVARSK